MESAKLYILLVSFTTSSFALVFEAEQGHFQRTGGVVMPRSAASNGYTVQLHQGAYIVLPPFRTTSSCTLTVLNVAYTNDGPPDAVTVSVNETVVGTFHSLAATDFGHNWNVVRNTGIVGNALNVASGTHTVRVTATSTDDHGVEIDRVDLAERCRVNSKSPPDSITVNTPTIVVGVTITISASLTCTGGIIAVCIKYMCKYRKK